MNSQFAPAKINLYLDVLGKRPDGYHLLDSLVVFASVGDELKRVGDGPFQLEVSGPFHQKIDGKNLIETAYEKLAQMFDLSDIGGFHLIKNMPVAAGMGGGSSDVAAFLHLIQPFLKDQPSFISLNWAEFALSLGADVPVCFYQKTALMNGVGEELVFTQGMPSWPALLINPGQPVSTKDIFTKLNALPVDLNNHSQQTSVHNLHTRPDWQGFIKSKKNDLQPIAEALVPEISDVLNDLAQTDGNWLVRMSGSGATCFGLYETEEKAKSAALKIKDQHPNWWVCDCLLGGQAP